MKKKQTIYMQHLPMNVLNTIVDYVYDVVCNCL